MNNIESITSEGEFIFFVGNFIEPGGEGKNSNEPIEEVDKSDEPSEQVKQLAEAEKWANLTLSFRRLKDLKWVAATIIFNFFGLATGNMKEGFEIILVVNPINLEGEKEENNTYITYKLDNAIIVEEGKSTKDKENMKKIEIKLLLLLKI